MTPIVQSATAPTQTEWDEWLAYYRTPAFLATDPMSLAAPYRDHPARCEAMALVAAMLAYGRRPLIIQFLQHFQACLGTDVHTYVTAPSFSAAKARRHLAGVFYRFQTSDDLVWLLGRLRWLYTHYPTLEALWLEAATQQECPPDWTPAAWAMQHTSLALMGTPPKRLTYGQRYLLPLPATQGACKRWWLFLRWVVRQDEDLAEPLDFGLWTKALTPADLLMPVDTHVGRLANQYGLTTITANNWRKAEAITAYFRQFRPQDPVAYDFALLGLGVNSSTQTAPP